MRHTVKMPSNIQPPLPYSCTKIHFRIRFADLVDQYLTDLRTEDIHTPTKLKGIIERAMNANTYTIIYMSYGVFNQIFMIQKSN